VAGVELFSLVRDLQFLLVDFGILPEDEQQNLLLFSDIVSGLVTHLGEVTSRRTGRTSSDLTACDCFRERNKQRSL
jgi:hypothetical protein